MKYGVTINLKTQEIRWDSVRAFNEDHWKSLMQRESSGWISLPKEKVFISFNEVDRKQMEILKNEINSSEFLLANVVEERRQGSLALAKLIVSSIDESKFFIAILSRESMSTQWVNQEIGYAFSKDSIETIPVVQDTVINDLKGFIHNQRQLPYVFSLSGNTRGDSRTFRKLSGEVIEYLERTIKSKHGLE